MTFSEQSFTKRLQTMGDIAERAFEERYDQNFCRYGLNRPSINMAMLPPHLRYTPDYLTSQALVEVQGLGSDQILKVKLDKYESLKWWNKTHPVVLFVYDSSNDRCAALPFTRLRGLFKNAEIDSFPEGKEYYAVPAALIWTDE